MNQRQKTNYTRRTGNCFHLVTLQFTVLFYSVLSLKCLRNSTLYLFMIKADNTSIRIRSSVSNDMRLFDWPVNKDRRCYLGFMYPFTT